MKTIISALIALFTVSPPASATGFAFKYRSTDLFSEDPQDTLFATVQIDGTTTDCLVDTGARFTLAKESLTKNNNKVGEVLGGGVSGVQRTADLVESKIHVGDWDHPTGVIGRTDLIPFECIVGNDFFLMREFSIDFTRSRFSDETTFSGTTFPLQQYLSDRGGHFGFEIEVNEYKVPALFDTGATHTVIDIGFVQKHLESFEFIKELDVQEGSNQSIKAGLYRLKGLKMGPIVEKETQVYVLSLKHLQEKIPGIQAVIGLSEMKKHKWYINNKSSTWGVY